MSDLLLPSWCQEGCGCALELSTTNRGCLWCGVVWLRLVDGGCMPHSCVLLAGCVPIVFVLCCIYHIVVLRGLHTGSASVYHNTPVLGTTQLACVTD